MKIIQFKYLGLLVILGLFSGCSLISQSQSNSNKSTNSSNLNKPLETPTATPKVETNINTQTNQTPDINVNYNKSTDNTPKGKLDDKINQTNFDKINDGMSLADVAKIFDDKGMKISDMTVNGKHSEMYLWSTDDMKKKIKVTFEKEKVIEKEKSGF